MAEKKIGRRDLFKIAAGTILGASLRSDSSNTARIETGLDEAEIAHTLSEPAKPEFAHGIAEQCRIILDTYPNLDATRIVLENIRLKLQDGRERTGVEAVMELLENGYDPSRKSRELLQMTDEYLEHKRSESVYVLRVAHALWVESKGIVPWSLQDYSREQMAQFFYVPVPVGDGEDINRRPVMPLKSKSGFDYSSDWYDATNDNTLELQSGLLLYPIANKLKERTQRESLINIIRWLKTNFFHAYTDQDGANWDWEKYRDGQDGNNRPTPQSLTRYFVERIAGCHEPALVLSGLARSLNIPAMNINVEGHGVTFLPTEDRFVHGDHLSNLPAVPAEMLLLSQKDFADVAERPMLLELLQEKTGGIGTDENARYYSARLPNLKIGRVGNRLKVVVEEEFLTTPTAFAFIQGELAPFKPEAFLVGKGELLRVNFETIPIRYLEELRALP